jgi:hypothetical protein
MGSKVEQAEKKQESCRTEGRIRLRLIFIVKRKRALVKASKRWVMQTSKVV